MELQFPPGLVGHGLDLPFFQERWGLLEEHLLGLVCVLMEIEDTAFALGRIVKNGDILPWLLVGLLECLKIFWQLLYKLQAELADLYAIGHDFFGWKMLLEGIWSIQIINCIGKSVAGRNCPRVYTLSFVFQSCYQQAAVWMHSIEIDFHLHLFKLTSFLFRFLFKMQIFWLLLGIECGFGCSLSKRSSLGCFVRIPFSFQSVLSHNRVDFWLLLFQLILIPFLNK